MRWRWISNLVVCLLVSECGGVLRLVFVHRLPNCNRTPTDPSAGINNSRNATAETGQAILIDGGTQSRGPPSFNKPASRNSSRRREVVAHATAIGGPKLWRVACVILSSRACRRQLVAAGAFPPKDSQKQVEEKRERHRLADRPAFDFNF